MRDREIISGRTEASKKGGKRRKETHSDLSVPWISGAAAPAPFPNRGPGPAARLALPGQTPLLGPLLCVPEHWALVRSYKTMIVFSTPSRPASPWAGGLGDTSPRENPEKGEQQQGTSEALRSFQFLSLVSRVKSGKPLPLTRSRFSRSAEGRG